MTSRAQPVGGVKTILFHDQTGLPVRLMHPVAVETLWVRGGFSEVVPENTEREARRSFLSLIQTSSHRRVKPDGFRIGFDQHPIAPASRLLDCMIPQDFAVAVSDELGEEKHSQ